MTAVYLDASALVKLVLVEPESSALVADLASVDVRISSMIGRVELGRAIRRRGEDVERAIATVLAEIEFVSLHVASAVVASAIGPQFLRSLDAIHLACALEVRDDIDAFYCYDTRLAEAARSHGIEVRSPGAS